MIYPLPTGQQFLDGLRTAPLDFLRHYHVKISGANADEAGTVREFGIASADNTTIQGFTTGRAGGKGEQKARRVLRVQPMHPTNGRTTGGQEADAAHRIWAHYIPMWKDNDNLGTAAATLTPYQLPWPGNNPGTQANPDLLLTSEISGCTFGIGANAAGNRAVIHIQPDRDLPLPNRRPHQQATVTRILGPNPSLIYRREERLIGTATHTGYGDNNVTIIGIRTNNDWQFYAQIYNTAIVNALRIYPA